MLHDILLVIVGILIGAAIGFFGARTFMKKYLKMFTRKRNITE